MVRKLLMSKPSERSLERTAERKSEIKELVEKIKLVAQKVEFVRVMEVCGTHTVSFFRSGVRSLLPDNIHLISGPGCPVCVTSQGYIDAACEVALKENVKICTYGDMLRVPGRNGSLEELRGEGADVMVVYSARDALKFARENPAVEVVFLAVGFETTTPATAATLIEAKASGVTNFSVLAAHKLVMPALDALLSSGDVAFDGFILPGHVSVIIGTKAYEEVVQKYQKTSVITGFEPVQLLKGILRISELIAEKKVMVDNVYGVAVKDDGNPIAWKILQQVFEPADAVWRAMGTIPGSGLVLREEYKSYDAFSRFSVVEGEDYEPPGCLCGEVIQGKVLPKQCSHFGKACTPVKPIGPCMVSSEGTCAAWYKYGRN
jgi:hydrogenase expression/formation protein HypD